MTIIETIFKIGEIITPIISILILVRVYQLKQLTIKNQNIIMAALSDFQNVANEINTATQNISAYVQGGGMSAADQDTALKLVQDAVTNLNAVVPASTPVE